MKNFHLDLLPIKLLGIKRSLTEWINPTSKILCLTHDLSLVCETWNNIKHMSHRNCSMAKFYMAMNIISNFLKPKQAMHQVETPYCYCRKYKQNLRPNKHILISLFVLESKSYLLVSSWKESHMGSKGTYHYDKEIPSSEFFT